MTWNAFRAHQVTRSVVFWYYGEIPSHTWVDSVGRSPKATLTSHQPDIALPKGRLSTGFQ